MYYALLLTAGKELPSANNTLKVQLSVSGHRLLWDITVTCE
jgi:hypothetical protein